MFSYKKKALDRLRQAFKQGELLCEQVIKEGRNFTDDEARNLVKISDQIRQAIGTFTANLKTACFKNEVKTNDVCFSIFYVFLTQLRLYCLTFLVLYRVPPY